MASSLIFSGVQGGDQTSSADDNDSPPVTEGKPQIYAHLGSLIVLAFCILGVGLVAATRALCNRRFDEQAIVAIFALAALSQMSWKELVRAVMDLMAWNKARMANLNRQQRREREARAGQPAAS